MNMKTEICLFDRSDQPLINVKIQNVTITSKKSMIVLGVIFDSKLNWNLQVASSISKAKKKLFALRILKKIFTPDQMRILLDSHFYSVLYYNSVIWLTPELNAPMKQNLLSISANALRTCLTCDNPDVSFENLHFAKKVPQSRDNGNDFLFPVPFPFLKLNDNCVKSFLSGYPIF